MLFRSLACHNAPHADDAFSMEEIIVEGTKEFADQYAVNGVIPLGHGGGPFDDHVGMKQGLPKEKSCSVLVAEALGIDKNPRWMKMLKYINRNDVGGSVDQTDVASLLKQMHRQRPDHQIAHVNWFLAAIHAKWYDYRNGNFTIKHIAEYMKENRTARGETDPDKWLRKGERARKLNRDYFLRALQEIKVKQAMGEVVVRKFYHDPSGQIVSIVGIESDNYRMNAALRSDLGMGAGVTVIISSDGQGYVGSNKRLGIKLNEVMAIVRMTEQAKQVSLGMIDHVVVTDWDKLREPGTIDQIPAWHFDTLMNPHMIYNGNLSSPDTPPTSLNLYQLVEAVLIGLDQGMFHPQHKFFCSRGHCEAGKRCLFYAAGLDRCRPEAVASRKGKQRSGGSRPNNHERNGGHRSGRKKGAAAQASA